MLKRRRNKKVSKKQLQSFKLGMSSIVLVCKVCGEEEVSVSSDCTAVTCAYCVQRMLPPPEKPKSAQKSDKPRGWHFKSYFEQDGIIYSKGVEVTDPKEIVRLTKLFGKKSVKVAVTPKVKKVKAKTKQTKPTVRGKKNARTSK